MYSKPCFSQFPRGKRENRLQGHSSQGQGFIPVGRMEGEKYSQISAIRTVKCYGALGQLHPLFLHLSLEGATLHSYTISLGFFSFFDNFFSFKDFTHNPTLPFSNAELLVPLPIFLRPETAHSKSSPADSHALSILCRGEPD